MKILKPRQLLLIITVSIVFIMGVVSLWLFMPFVRRAFDIYWILPAGIIVLLLTPLSKIRLSAPTDTEPRYSFYSWFLRVVALEFSLIAIFYGICYISGHLLPILTKAQPTLFTNTLFYSFVHLGLFPFTIFSLIACVFGYISYQGDTDAYLSTALYPILKSTTDNTVGLIINTTARAATMYALSSSIAFMSLLIISFFAPHKALLAFIGFSPVPLVAVFILLTLILNKKFNQQIYFLITKKQLPSAIIMIGFTILLSMGLIVLILFFADHGSTIIRTPALIKSLLKHGWGSVWQLFTSLWWISWAPITGIFIAKISRGYSMRGILLVTLIPPFFISVILLLTHHFHLTMSHHRIFDIVGFIIPFIGFLLVLSFIARKKTFSILTQTYLPKRDKIKHRNQDRFVRKLLQFSAFMLYLYLLAGITILCILFFVFMLILCLVLLALPFALLRGLWETRHRRKKVHASMKKNSVKNKLTLTSKL